MRNLKSGLFNAAFWEKAKNWEGFSHVFCLALLEWDCPVADDVAFYPFAA